MTKVDPSEPVSDHPTVGHALARSWLLVAASDTIALGDAFGSAADQVILDLEDGVPLALRAEARRKAPRWILAHRPWVRISDVRSDQHALDLEALVETSGVRGIFLAKVESADEVYAVAERLPDVPIIPMIESARGLTQALSIAEAAPSVRLAFGVGDFRFDTGIGDSWASLGYARSHLVVASKAACLPGPIDGPSASAETLLIDSKHAAQLGMSGRLMVRHEDAPTVNSAMTPSDEDIASAEAVVAKLGFNGEQVVTGADVPRLAAAKSTLELAASFGAYSF